MGADAMRLKTVVQLAGVAYAAYLAWWLTRDGWPDCCPCCGWEDGDE